MDHPLVRKQRNQAALGLICTHSFPAVVGTADMMLKSADVTLVGYEKTGSGYCTAVIRGGFADIRIAIEAGVATARQFDQYVSSTIVPRPLPNLDAVLPISPRLAAITEGHAHHATGALGLVETLGFAAMVGAADAMLKSANVRLVTYEKTGSGLCTAIIQGNVADVTVAVEAGMFEAERIGSLHAIMVIPRPLEDLMRSLPEPQQREATPQPLRLPLQVREKTPLVELPVLERVPEKLPVSVEAAVEELKQVSLQAEETDLL